MAEDVWQYPRPPAAVPSTEHVVVELGGEMIVETWESVRILETSHPPTYYLPYAAFTRNALREGAGSTFCEFKGWATYLDLAGGDGVAVAAAWTYLQPSAGYESLLDHVAIHPGRVDRCTVDGEVVQAQDGGFYGGWITSRVSGPFKGAPGTLGW